MNIKKLIVLIPFILLPILCRADLGQLMALERNLEMRILDNVKAIDSDAQVLVRIELKAISVTLPGTSLNFNGSPSTQLVDMEDIQDINVKVFTTQDSLPEWLNNRIKEIINYPKVRTNISVEKLQPEALELIQLNNPGQQFGQWLSHNANKLKNYGLLLFSLIFALAITLIGAVALFLPNLIKNQMSRLVDALGMNKDAGPDMQTMQKVVTQEQSDAGPSQKDSTRLEDFSLPDEGLVELIADCYWTEADEYAKWLWGNVSSEQKIRLIGLWAPMYEYAEFFQNLNAKGDIFHGHPYYFRPNSIRDVNNADIQKFVLKHHEAWQKLSPLRQQALKIPIEEKLKMNSVPVKTTTQIAWPKEISQKRDLTVSRDIGELSINDDYAIMNHPDMIAKEERRQVASLVWVSLLPLEKQQELLSQMSALDLAKIWVGPEEVLSKLKVAIPEKKWKLIEGYFTMITPSRSSSAFKALSKQAVTLLNESVEVKNDLLSNAS